MVSLTVFKYLVFASPLYFTRHDSSGVTTSVLVDFHFNYLKIHSSRTKMAHERTIVDRMYSQQQQQFFFECRLQLSECHFVVE